MTNKLINLAFLALVTVSNLAGCAVDEPTADETSLSESTKPGADVLLDGFDSLEVEGADGPSGQRNVPEHPELDGDEEIGVDVSELLDGWRLGAGVHRASDAAVADHVVAR